MALPLNPAIIGRLSAALAVTPSGAPAPGVGVIVTDQAAVAAFVHAADAQAQAILDTVRARSQGAFTFPDSRLPCTCGPQADNLDSLKAWDGDPAWCVRKDGPIAAPVDRTVQNCADMPALFWPDVWVAAQQLLRGYLTNPPAHDADPSICASWTTRVFELCSAMATSTNVSPALFCAFMGNPVGPDFTPRVRLELFDQNIPVYDEKGNVVAQRRVWITRPVPGQTITTRQIADAIHGVPPMQTNTLPPLPSQIASMWACPVPPNDRPWLGAFTSGPIGRDGRQTTAQMLLTPDAWTDETLHLAWDAYGGPPTDPLLRYGTGDGQFDGATGQFNRWMDDALTPVYFKTLWNLVRQQSNDDPNFNRREMLPEWVCQNSRTQGWMLGDMQPFRPGWFIWDGISMWPVGGSGADSRATIVQLRNADTYTQLETLFRMMNGAWSAPGWVFYKEWYKGENAIGAAATGDFWTPYQHEQLGPAYVPGAWFYMSAAYRWGAWFSGLDYTTVVNSALYAFVSNYLPGVVSEYSYAAGASIATPQQVQALHAQITAQFQTAARQSTGSALALGGAAVSVAAALAGTGVGMILGIALALVTQLVQVFAVATADAKAALATFPIYSPTIRTPVDPNCHVDAGSGSAALEVQVPGLTAPAATAAIATFIASVQATQRRTNPDAPQAPAGTSTVMYVALGVAGVAAVAALVLALRKR